jgi:hypothetical protein
MDMPLKHLANLFWGNSKSHGSLLSKLEVVVPSLKKHACNFLRQLIQQLSYLAVCSLIRKAQLLG